jgi:hypothetical protein
VPFAIETCGTVALEWVFGFAGSRLAEIVIRYLRPLEPSGTFGNSCGIIVQSGIGVIMHLAAGHYGVIVGRVVWQALRTLVMD